MATATYIRSGEIAEYINTTDAVIKNGTVLSLKTRIGIAASDIAVGTKGAVYLCGVYSIAKAASLAISQGDAVYYNTSNGNIDKTASGIPAGFAISDAGTNDATVLVKIG